MSDSAILLIVLALLGVLFFVRAQSCQGVGLALQGTELGQFDQICAAVSSTPEECASIPLEKGWQCSWQARANACRGVPPEGYALPLDEFFTCALHPQLAK